MDEFGNPIVVPAEETPVADEAIVEVVPETEPTPADLEKIEEVAEPVEEPEQIEITE